MKVCATATRLIFFFLMLDSLKKMNLFSSVDYLLTQSKGKTPTEPKIAPAATYYDNKKGTPTKSSNRVGQWPLRGPPPEASDSAC